MSPSARRTTTNRLAILAAIAGFLYVPLSVTVGPAADAVNDCPTPARHMVRAAPGAGKTVSLTFDDGPTRFTPQILKVLRQHDVRATFFHPGRRVAERPRLAAQVAAEGHLLENHTYDHAYPSEIRGGWTRTYLASQFRRTNMRIRDVTGHRPCFFRPPGGHQTSGMTDVARNHGMSTVMWSVDTEDWRQPRTTTSTATNRISSRALAGLSQSNPLVLFHDGKASREPERQVSSNRSNTVNALPAVIRAFKRNGYRFVDLRGTSGLPPAPTTLRLRSTQRIAIASGDRVTAAVAVLRSVTGPAANRRITWYSRRVGKLRWIERGHVRTSSEGRATLIDRPRVSTEYLLRWPGGPGLARSQSHPRRVTVEQPPPAADTPSEPAPDDSGEVQP